MEVAENEVAENGADLILPSFSSFFFFFPSFKGKILNHLLLHLLQHYDGCFPILKTEIAKRRRVVFWTGHHLDIFFFFGKTTG